LIHLELWQFKGFFGHLIDAATARDLVLNIYIQFVRCIFLSYCLELGMIECEDLFPGELIVKANLLIEEACSYVLIIG
jgi:hypothetical protein